MRKLFILLFAMALLFGAEAKKLDKNFTLTTVDGKKIHIHIKKNGIEVKEYPNKVIILDFFGKNCPPCRMEIPILGDLQKKMADTLQIIGLHVQRPLSSSDLAMLKKLGVDYPIVDYAVDKNNYEFVEFMGELTGWSGTIPFMLFFDRNGNYAGYHLGMAEESSLERFVQKLANPKVETSKESNTTKK